MRNKDSMFKIHGKVQIKEYNLKERERRVRQEIMDGDRRVWRVDEELIGR